jgi:putative oxidoreductase
MTNDAIAKESAINESTTRSHARTETKSLSLLIKLAEVFARWALGAAFLSAVADRFGLWGAYGKPLVAWGDFAHFTHYTGMVNSFLPARVIPAVAWMATIAETTFGLALILGIYKRAAAFGSAVLLLLLALAMSISFGIKAPLDYSVFGASAAAFLLFAILQATKS